MRVPDDRHHVLRWRALLDGEDVTDRCFLADDKTGEVGLYVRRGDGRFAVDRQKQEVVRQFRHGRVELIQR